LPAVGEIANQRQVEIAELGEAQTAGDRCGGHHQGVGQPALFPKSGALANSKPVLFIDHHQPQVGELHPLLNEGLGADDQLGRPVGDLAEGLAALGGGE